MRAPAFWWRERSLAGALLGPLGARVGALTAARMAEVGARAAIPVICVGNFVAGGAGKTPTAIALAKALAARGETPFLLSRGYGGRIHGPVRVDPAAHRAADVGDEPLLLARAAPTIVARDRPAGAAMAAAQGAGVIVLDDGWQNPSLAKDFVLAVVDGARGVGNGRCLPAGPLRAPLERQIALCDAVLVVGDGAAGQTVARYAASTGRPAFSGALVADGDVAASLRGRRVLAVAGLGRPEKLRDSLNALGADVTALHALPDHAAPSEARTDAILDQARALDARIVTTEKDMVKWTDLRPRLAEAADALPVSLAIHNGERLLAMIADALAARRKA